MNVVRALQKKNILILHLFLGVHINPISNTCKMTSYKDDFIDL